MRAGAAEGGHGEDFVDFGMQEKLHILSKNPAILQMQPMVDRKTSVGWWHATALFGIMQVQIHGNAGELRYDRNLILQTGKGYRL